MNQARRSSKEPTSIGNMDYDPFYETANLNNQFSDLPVSTLNQVPKELRDF